MHVLFCESELHEDKEFIFKADHEVSEEEFDEFVRNEHPEEYDECEDTGDWDEPDDWGEEDEEEYDEDEEWDDSYLDEDYCFLKIKEQKEVPDDDPILEKAELIEGYNF